MGEWSDFLVGVVCGLSLAGLLWIVIAPSRRARAETGLDPEVETRLLLGEIPDDEDPPASESSEPEHPRQYGPHELQALRRLGQQPSKRSKPR
ncbi:MAG TPA: hypothetical protein VFZ83_09825 [Acidimicrobiia bacterium]|nr:hypothetical protein [Acidimicrobiia bacterium]